MNARIKRKKEKQRRIAKENMAKVFREFAEIGMKQMRYYAGKETPVQMIVRLQNESQ